MRRAQLIGLAGIVVASGLWATPAAGQESTYNVTGNDLIRLCEGAAEAVASADQGYCRGLITGAIQITRTGEYQRSGLNYPCVPSNATFSQMIRVVLRYLEDNPERLHLPDYVLAVEAALAGFPCSP